MTATSIACWTVVLWLFVAWLVGAAFHLLLILATAKPLEVGAQLKLSRLVTILYCLRLAALWPLWTIRTTLIPAAIAIYQVFMTADKD